jgi:hypothetical protein
MALRDYATEHGGQFPKLSRKEGCLMFDYSGPITEWITLPEVLKCPYATQRSADLEVTASIEDCASYWYLGYAVRNVQDLKRLDNLLTECWWTKGKCDEYKYGLEPLTLSLSEREYKPESSI